MEDGKRRNKKKHNQKDLLVCVLIVVIGVLIASWWDRSQNTFENTTEKSEVQVAGGTTEIGISVTTEKQVNEGMADGATNSTESDRRICEMEGCGKEAVMSGDYCRDHSCLNKNCNAAPVSGGLYCASHTCNRGKTICRNKVYEAGDLCEDCQRRAGTMNNTSVNHTTSGTSSKTNSSHSTSSKKDEMPDCDNYEDYEEFMDEWDGYMPDGSDAEDYWENW